MNKSVATSGRIVVLLSCPIPDLRLSALLSNLRRIVQIPVVDLVKGFRSKPFPARKRFLHFLLGLRVLGHEILGLALLCERVNLDPFILQCPIT